MRSELAERVLRAFGTETMPEDSRPFFSEEDGEPYDVWRLTWPDRSAVLKRTTPEERAVYETFFGKGGGPVPEIYGFAEFEGRLYILMEYVEGETLSHCTRRKLIPALDALIDIQERWWNDTDPERARVGYGFDACLAHLEKRLSYMGELADTYREYLEAFRASPRTLCNDDMLPFNVVVSGDRAVILDWEYGGILPWPCALARFLAYGEEPEDGEEPGDDRLFVMSDHDRRFALDYYYERLISKKGISRAEYDRTMRLFLFKEYSEWIYCVNSGGEKREDYEKYYRKALSVARQLGDWRGLTEFDLDGVRAGVDLEATRAWYETAEGWDCKCGHCRNLMALARERRLPKWGLELLDRLGIPAGKPTCVCMLCPRDGGLYYSINYRLCGVFSDRDGQGFLDGRSGHVVCGFDPAPAEADGFPEPYFDLILFCTLPWVLDEPVDGPES